MNRSDFIVKLSKQNKIGYVGDTIEVFGRDSLSSDKLSSVISKKFTESVRSSISSTTCVSETLMSSEREILDPHDEFEFNLDFLLKVVHKRTTCAKNNRKMIFRMPPRTFEMKSFL
ncbi:hypothetical protein HHI36_013162 [Cryptolaemus montrouzieri]|uniref:Uncharacterized protein n=1 Tax=Cryptolaemus montrouzieri TaxID=559131 RepID=A0ABD2NHE7_9CUCU